MRFAMLDFDDYGNDPVMSDGTQLKGINLSCASAPPDSTLDLSIDKSDRAVDMLVIDLAYKSGAKDLCRYQWPDQVEWFFKPSWHAAFCDFDMRLADTSISDDGVRESGSHGLFPHRFYDDFESTDCYQYIYELCDASLVKK